MTYFPSSTGSTLIVYLSQHKIVSDAINGLDYGVTAPTGSTGQETAINTLIANSVTTAQNLGLSGVKFIWDVAVALGGPIYLYSNTTIEAMPGCGAIVRANALCPIFRLHGMETTPTSTNSVASQNCFGMIDPSHGSDYRYRVFNAGFVNASNVTILSGTWNNNAPQQPAIGPNAQNQITTQYGFVSVMQFWGIDGLTIRGARIFLPSGFGIHLINWRNVFIEQCDCDNHVQTYQDSNCIQFEGPGHRSIVRNIRTHAPDDNIAFNADDVATLSASSGILTAGLNWSCSGPIDNCLVEDIEIWDGRENVRGYGTVRLLTTSARIDNITLRRISGLTARWGCLFETIAGQSLLGGNGNLGRVIFEDCSFDLTTGTGTSGIAPIQINFTAETVEIRNRYRYNAQGFPDLYIENGALIQKLIVSGTWFESSTASNAEPILLVAGGTVVDIELSGTLIRDPALAIVSAPVFRQTGGTIGTVKLNFDANRITNMCELIGGSLTSLFLRGEHRIAGGGSPLSIASGLTLTNYVYSQLVYDHNNVPAYTGSGYITHNGDYNESTAVSYATSYTTAYSPSTGQVQNSPITITYTPVAGTWPVGLTLTPSVSNITGSFTATTLYPSGMAPATVTFTPTNAITGSFNSTPSGGSPAGITNTTGSYSYTTVAASSLLLDVVSWTGQAVALSLRKLRSAYGNSQCIRVQYTGGHADEDIGFVSGVLDTATLLSHAGSGDAFVSIIYDQSGNNNYASQSNRSNQFKIVSAGVMNKVNNLAALVGSSASGMFAGIPNGISSTMTVLAVARNAVASTDRRLITYIGNGDLTDYSYPTSAMIICSDNSSGASLQGYRNGVTLAPKSASQTVAFQAAATWDGTNYNLSINNGTPGTTASSGSFASSGTLNVGCGINNSLNTPFNSWVDCISEIVLFSSLLNSGDLTKAYANQKAYYGTP